MPSNQLNTRNAKLEFAYTKKIKSASCRKNNLHVQRPYIFPSRMFYLKYVIITNLLKHICIALFPNYMTTKFELYRALVTRRQ